MTTKPIVPSKSFTPPVYRVSSNSGNLSHAISSGVNHANKANSSQITRNIALSGGGIPAPYSAPSSGPTYGPHNSGSNMRSIAQLTINSQAQKQFDNVGNKTASDATVGGAKYKKRKYRKSKKYRKSRKSMKSRKSRKSMKSRKSRKSRKSMKSMKSRK